MDGFVIMLLNILMFNTYVYIIIINECEKRLTAFADQW